MAAIRTASGFLLCGAVVLFAACASTGDRPVPAESRTPPAAAQPASENAQEPRVNEDARLIAEFNARVKEYVALHQKLESTLPKLRDESTPEQIHVHQRALEKLIGRARAGAQQGDIFQQPIRAYFRRQLSRLFSGPDGRQLKSSIMDENPGSANVEINGRYPDSVPLSTVPPQLLLLLPRLPDELEYRFIGERLILLDVHAQIIVDFIDAALPR